MTPDITPLLEEEIVFMNVMHRCCDCFIGRLLCGPQGGSSMNVKCDNPDCGHEFCIAVYRDEILPMGGERIHRDEPQYYSELLFPDAP